MMPKPVRRNTFFEQVADECQHEDAYDEYHDEAQHGGELLARTEPSAYRPAEAHGEEDAQHESRDAARLYDDAFAPSGHGGDEEQDEQYDVERIHVVSFAMGLCHESSKKSLPLTPCGTGAASPAECLRAESRLSQASGPAAHSSERGL